MASRLSFATLRTFTYTRQNCIQTASIAARSLTSWLESGGTEIVGRPVEDGRGTLGLCVVAWPLDVGDAGVGGLCTDVDVAAVVEEAAVVGAGADVAVMIGRDAGSAALDGAGELDGSE